MRARRDGAVRPARRCSRSCSARTRTPTSLIDALAHKQVDVVSGLPDSDVGRLEALPNVTVDHASDGTQYVLRDYAARRAASARPISLAIDRTALVAKAVDGVGTPGVVP